MILAFLRAEVHSARFKNEARRALRGDLSLVAEGARLDSAYENTRRREALMEYRGYGRNAFLFRSFPAMPAWKRVALTRADLAALKYAKAPEWVLLSRGSRLVSDALQNLDTPVARQADVPAIVASVGWPAEYAQALVQPEWTTKTRQAATNITQVARELSKGREYPEIILVAENPDAQHIILEGHTRASAYVLHLSDGAPDEIEALASYSPNLPRWGYY
jgi:hypothetical protein